MEISQGSLARLYFYALLLGIAAGFLYDLLRITRVFLGVHYSRRAAKRLGSIKLPLLGVRRRRGESRALGTVVFVEDLLFCLAVGVAMILLFYGTNNGRIRMLAFVAAGAGFLLYRATVGRLVMLFSEIIAFCVETAFRYAFFFLLYPIKRTTIFLQKRCATARLRVRNASQKRTRRRFTERERERMLKNACGMVPESVGKQRTPKRGKQIAKSTKKTVQPHTADARASRRAGSGVGRGVRQ